MVPIVNGLKAEYEGTVEFKIYDVDKSEEGSALMQQLGLRYVPTFVFVNGDGTIADQVIGESTEDAMRQRLDVLQ